MFSLNEIYFQCSVLDESLQIASTSSVFVEACFNGPLLLPLPLISTGFVFVPASGFDPPPPPPEAALISRLSTEKVIFCLDFDSLAAAAAAVAADEGTAVWVERLTESDLERGLS